jgi:hypothetical protein
MAFATALAVPVGIADVGRLDFRTSRSGDTATSAIQRALGLQFRYQPARLAIGRSLGLPTRPALVQNLDGKAIRGETLFGQSVQDLGMWMSLIVEHAGAGPLVRRELQDLVSAHWARGAGLLWDQLRDAADPLAEIIRQVGKASQ